MSADRPIVLSIAGFDPCGGAGVLADVKTFEQCAVQGMAIVTAQTLQTEHRVFSVRWQATEDVLQAITILMQTYPVKAVKIGIVKDLSFLRSIVTCIKAQNENTFLVWDPVLKSSSGFAFFNARDLHKLSSIWHQLDLVTPNFEEYTLLAPHFMVQGPKALLIKGGHRKERVGVDILLEDKNEIELLPEVRMVRPKHGSGCILSAAIAAHIALGHDLENACRKAKFYVERFLNSHPSLLGYHANI